MDIILNKDFKVKNVISYRGVFQRNEIRDAFLKMDGFIAESRLAKKGEYALRVHSAEITNMEYLIDAELLCIVSGVCKALPEGFTFISDMSAEQVISVHYEGTASEMFTVTGTLRDYANKEGFLPCDLPCAVLHNDITDFSLDKTITADIYLPVIKRVI